ncbi:MAG: hypothetical protein IK118_03290, partial [Clostridia bacterium]|nr:hypothetical protein [Clostridia bacterium]
QKGRDSKRKRAVMPAPTIDRRNPIDHFGSDRRPTAGGHARPYNPCAQHLDKSEFEWIMDNGSIFFSHFL